MIRNIFCKLTGYRFWYHTKLEYRINSKPIYRMTLSLGTSCPSGLADHRSIKKEEAPDLIKDIPKHMLKNGTVSFEPLCYIGFFKRK